MPINLANLKKLETPSASSQARARPEDERMVVIIKLKPGARRPGYIAARGEISQQIFTAEVPASELPRLEADPDVDAVSVSRSMPVIK